MSQIATLGNPKRTGTFTANIWGNKEIKIIDQWDRGCLPQLIVLDRLIKKTFVRLLCLWEQNYQIDLYSRFSSDYTNLSSIKERQIQFLQLLVVEKIMNLVYVLAETISMIQKVMLILSLAMKMENSNSRYQQVMLLSSAANLTWKNLLLKKIHHNSINLQWILLLFPKQKLTISTSLWAKRLLSNTLNRGQGKLISLINKKKIVIFSVELWLNHLLKKVMVLVSAVRKFNSRIWVSKCIGILIKL